MSVMGTIGDAAVIPCAISTTRRFMDLQRVVYAARTLEDVRDYLRNEMNDFVRSLRPVQVVKFTEQSESKP